jgi:hypothetical protein
MLEPIQKVMRGSGLNSFKKHDDIQDYDTSLQDESDAEWEAIAMSISDIADSAIPPPTAEEQKWEEESKRKAIEESAEDQAQRLLVSKGYDDLSKFRFISVNNDNNNNRARKNPLPGDDFRPIVPSRAYFTEEIMRTIGEGFIGETPEIETSFNNQVAKVVIKFIQNQRFYQVVKFIVNARAIVDIVAYFATYAYMILTDKKDLGAQKACKVNISFTCIFNKKLDDGTTEYRKFVLDDTVSTADKRTRLRTCTQVFKSVTNSAIDTLQDAIFGTGAMPRQQLINMDSKFTFYSLKKAEITVFTYDVLKVSAGSYLPLPPKLQRSTSVVNPECETGCFKQCILLGLIQAKMGQDFKKFRHKQRSSVVNKKALELGIHVNFEGFDGIVAPLHNLLDKFCKTNPEIGIRIYAPSPENEHVPIYMIYQSVNITGCLQEVTLINLLYLSKKEDGKVPDGEPDGENILQEEEEKDDCLKHYAFISNVDALLSRARSNKTSHHVHICPVCLQHFDKRNSRGGLCPIHEVPLKRKGDPIQSEEAKVFFCPKCMTRFDNQEEMDIHQDLCLIKDKNYRIINLPEQRMYLEPSVTDLKKCAPICAWMTADFECILQPKDKTKCKTRIISKHVPCSFSVCLCTCFEGYSKFSIYTGTSGQDTVEKFCNTILAFSKDYYDYVLSRKEPMLPLTPEEKENFENATHCCYCQREFNPQEQGLTKVADHDHVTGKYIGASCSNCNVMRVPSRQAIPLFFHNGRNYDMHLFLKEITKRKYGCTFEGIAQNSQKFMSLTISKSIDAEYVDAKGKHKKGSQKIMCDIKVLDSILFMLVGLETLTTNLKEKNKDLGASVIFPTTFQAFQGLFGVDEAKVELALQKNLYPYLWFNSFDKFKLPIEELKFLFDGDRYEYFTDNATEAFKERFQRLKPIFYQVVKAYGCKTVEDYANIYLAMDTCQLMDILNNARQVYYNVHGLDMYQFMGMPGYTWAAYQIHLMNHPVYDIAGRNAKPWLFKQGEMNMIGFFVKAIRGGCSGIMLRYARTNNKFTPQEYDPSKMSNFLIYLDANNLYGWSMMQDLPYGYFEWVAQDEIPTIQEDIMTYLEENLGNGRGAYLEVDLEYPSVLHPAHNYYPLAPVKRPVKEEELSPYSRYLNTLVNRKHDSKVDMLLQTLEDREHYCVYYKNLRFYLKHGMVLKKIHRILEFNEAPIMRSYIEKNTEMRNKATNTADRNLWKIANNSAYGKTFENQLNYSILKFVHTMRSYNTTVAKPGFDGTVFMSDNLMIAKILHDSITFNKPIYLGATITELAKLHMYEFYYDVLIDYFGANFVQLCMTDTDSLLLNIWTGDIYSDIAEIQRRYDCPIDTSNFDESIISLYGIEGHHNKEVGYFKSETGSARIKEFVGLRAKVYSYLMEGEEDDTAQHLRAKGVGKGALCKMYHEAYKECIFNQNEVNKIQQEVTVPLIRSTDHKVQSLQVNKIGLSCNDTKRFICKDNINTYAFGHFAIAEETASWEK